MAPRTSWKGFLRLSLVSVPLRAFGAAASGNEIRLNQLHGECHSRIKYQKACPNHGVVGNDEIVKGYEYAKDQYVVIEDDEIAKLRPASDRTIGLEGFVPAGTIDPIHFSGRTYYTAPDGVVGEKPYHLLLKIMEDRGLVALGRMVLTGKEHLLLVRPLDGVLALTMLNYAEDVKAIDEYRAEVGEGSFNDAEMQLTETLVDASMIDDFDFSSYTNVYAGEVRKLIQAKVDGEELVTAPAREEPQILNLMEALKKSVASAQTSAPAPKKPARKKMAKSTSARKPAAKRKKKTG